MPKLGAIGAGMIFAAYDQAAETLPNVKIVAVADPNRDRLSAVASSGRQLFTDVDDLLRLPLDAVLVLAPNACHASLVRRCIVRGLDTLCEKPLATTVDEAHQLLALSAAQGTFLYVAMHCRHRPEVQYLRDNLRSDVVFFSQIYRENWMQAPDWYFDPVQSGGGVLLDVGINQIDWILPFIYPVKAETVQMNFGGTDVELDCRIEWQHRRGKGVTMLSWRAKEEHKTTHVVTDCGDVFELDHQYHSIIHNGKRSGPWRSTEYAEVLKNFMEQRHDVTARQPTNVVELLGLLRSIYAQAGLQFLSSSAPTCVAPLKDAASEQRMRHFEKKGRLRMLSRQTQFDNIPMLNLVRQQERIHDRLHEAVLGAIADGIYISQEPVTPFEEKLARYCGRPYAVGVGSGTAALHIALIACGIGAGDEVVTVPNSFFATTGVILHVGARPIFVDIDPKTHLMSIEGLADAITDRTRAIMLVHLYGNVVDIDAIHRLLGYLRRQDVIVIEDCAHAIGAWRGERSVPLGRIGAFSFNPGKNIGALGDAGAIVTSDPEIAKTARLLRDHGRTEKNTHLLVGFNSRLSRINDRVLVVKLDYLDEWNERRRDIARRYDMVLAELSGITPVVTPQDVRSAYHQYVVCASKRDLLRKYLKERGISTGIHYPKLIPEQEPLRRLGYTLEEVPTAVQLNRQILSLPCYAELTDAEVDRIINEVSEFCRQSDA